MVPDTDYKTFYFAEWSEEKDMSYVQNNINAAAQSLKCGEWNSFEYAFHVRLTSVAERWNVVILVANVQMN